MAWFSWVPLGALFTLLAQTSKLPTGSLDPDQSWTWLALVPLKTPLSTQTWLSSSSRGSRLSCLSRNPREAILPSRPRPPLLPLETVRA